MKITFGWKTIDEKLACQNVIARNRLLSTTIQFFFSSIKIL